jgi:type III secretion protein V
VIAKPGEHPISHSPTSLVTEEQREVLEASGIAVWSPAGVVALHLAAVVRQRVKEFLGLQEVSELVDRMEVAFPALVKEVVPKVVSLFQLGGVLRRLVDEGVSIRDLKAIFEALGEHGRYENDELALTERVRAALSTQLAHSYAGSAHRLDVILLDPLIEEAVLTAAHPTASGLMLALEPELARSIQRAIASVLRPLQAQGARPAILTQANVRRLVRKLIEADFQRIPVLSFDELPGDLTIQPLGRANIEEAEAAA